MGNVFIDLDYFTEDMLDKSYLRWLYTAMTRASKKLYLINLRRSFLNRESRANTRFFYYLNPLYADTILLINSRIYLHTYPLYNKYKKDNQGTYYCTYHTN